ASSATRLRVVAVRMNAFLSTTRSVRGFSSQQRSTWRTGGAAPRTRLHLIAKFTEFLGRRHDIDRWMVRRNYAKFTDMAQPLCGGGVNPWLLARPVLRY